MPTRQQQREHLGGCAEPVRPTGRTTTVATTTGGVLHPCTSSADSTGSLLSACGNRHPSRRPARSRPYAADTCHLIRAGLSGGKTVRTHPGAFVTLIPPPFGPVHNRPTAPGGDIRPGRCRKLHEPEATLIGTPPNPATYDWAGAVLCNAHAGALGARFTTYLRRELAARPGPTQKATRQALRIFLAKPPSASPPPPARHRVPRTQVRHDHAPMVTVSSQILTPTRQLPHLAHVCPDRLVSPFS